MEDQGIDFTEILAHLSDVKIASICNVIRRPDGLASGRMPDRGGKKFILLANNLTLAMFTMNVAPRLMSLLV